MRRELVIFLITLCGWAVARADDEKVINESPPLVLNADPVKKIVTSLHSSGQSLIVYKELENDRVILRAFVLGLDLEPFELNMIGQMGSFGGEINITATSTGFLVAYEDAWNRIIGIPIELGYPEPTLGSPKVLTSIPSHLRFGGFALRSTSLIDGDEVLFSWIVQFDHQSLLLAELLASDGQSSQGSSSAHTSNATYGLPIEPPLPPVLPPPTTPPPFAPPPGARLLGPGAKNLQLTTGGNSLLAVWQEGQGHTSIRASLFRLATRSFEGSLSGELLSAASVSSRTPSVTFDGESYLTLWEIDSGSVPVPVYPWVSTFNEATGVVTLHSIYGATRLRPKVKKGSSSFLYYNY